MRDEHETEPRRTSEHRVGEPLDTLSVEELTARIALLHAEVARLEAARAAKTEARARAGAIFRL